MRDPSPLRDSGRRDFLRAAALAGLAHVTGAPLVSFAQTAPKPDAPPAGAMPVKSDSAAAPAGPPPLSEDARSLAEIVRRRYGQHLTPEQLEAVTRELDQRVQSGRRLRDAKLANSDEPDFTFRA
jgi:GAF domain-containing protein